MFNIAEKEAALSGALTMSELIKNHRPNGNGEKEAVLIKALANYIEKTSHQNPAELLQEIQQSLSEGNLHRALQRLLIHMVTVGTSETPLAVRMYTTGEIARFFGVSVATINNWLQQDRILGVEKGARFKQARIPENAVYISRSGEHLTIQEAAQMYETDQGRFNRQMPMTPAEELAELLAVVIHYEKKYGGQYKDTLAQKSALTLEEKRDALEWTHLLRRVEQHNA